MNLATGLDQCGYARAGPLLSEAQCRGLIDGYAHADAFRTRIDMARYRFGRGEYQYYAYPLPEVVEELRRNLYAQLAPLANRWAQELGWEVEYPDTLERFLQRCHQAGQERPTPLLLRYGPGDHNCLHQDMYGDVGFPLQVAVLLSDPVHGFSGGEFVLTEQRPRKQSRVEVVDLQRGEGVIFPVNQRPVQGKRGVFRATTRHGVSRLRSGERFCLGIIFHDAR